MGNPFDKDADPAPREGRIKRAQTFLTLELLAGPRLAGELERKALALGIKHATLAEARKRLGIVAERRQNRWYWIKQ